MKASYRMTVNVEFDNTASDSVNDLQNEIVEVQAAIGGAISTRVPKQYRGAVRVWVTRAELEEPE